jgi:hypothetical protein
MKRFKELTEELLNEGGEMYPADEMTLNELKVACYAAQNILERLENGAMIQRWQISAIVKAKEELASVYTNMSADEYDDEEWEDEDEWEDEEPMYVGFEYPSMYGEETEINESELDKAQRKHDRALKNLKDAEDFVNGNRASTGGKGSNYSAIGNMTASQKSKHLSSYIDAHAKAKSALNKAKKAANVSEEVEIDEASYRDSGARNMMRASQKADREVDKMRAQAAKRAEKEAAKKKPVEEETDYEVDVEGLPKMYVKGDNPSQVKNNLRKVVKNPEMIRGVERVAKATLQKIFRDKASGKEEVELDEARKSDSYQFTHKPGDPESEKRLADLKKSVKGTGKRVVLQGRLGKDNPNAHKYSKDAPSAKYKDGKRVNSDVSGKSGGHSHQRIQKADAAHHDVYVYDRNESVELDEASDLRITKVYNKFPKRATYAVHSPDRKYYKEFDSMEKAKAHHAEKTGK